MFSLIYLRDLSDQQLLRSAYFFLSTVSTYQNFHLAFRNEQKLAEWKRVSVSCLLAFSLGPVLFPIVLTRAGVTKIMDFWKRLPDL